MNNVNLVHESGLSLTCFQHTLSLTPSVERFLCRAKSVLMNSATFAAVTAVMMAVVLCPLTIPLFILMKEYNMSRRWDETLSNSQFAKPNPAVQEDGAKC